MELQHMNSFAYIYCVEIVVPCSWASIHISHYFFFLFASTCQKKKERKETPLGWFPPASGYNLTRSYQRFFLESKTLQSNILILFSSWEPIVLWKCCRVLLLAVCTIFSVVATSSRSVHRSTAQKSVYKGSILYVWYTYKQHEQSHGATMCLIIAP